MRSRDSEQESALVAPRVRFGTALRDLRKATGMRQRDLAATLGWSVSKVSMVERGERPADEEFVREADAALQADGQLVSAWQEASEHAARWPTWLAQWVEIERAAHTLRTWQPLIVPGLLQTEDYARAIFSGKPGITADMVEANVAARMERQHVLDREDGPMIWAVLDEGVLTRPIGSRAVMAGQMARLATLTGHPRVTVQILLQDSWLTTGLQGAFVLANGQSIPDMAYIESVTMSQITADPGRVMETRSRYDMIHGDAQPRRASLNLIRETERQWK
ncbi:helix-turn-helix domain-containing protein [Sinosporangium siamense]